MSTVKTLPELKVERDQVLKDFHLAVASREASLIGRKEVFMGKAKFGIFGDGKEIAQIAMAKAFRNGDMRAGYYRDQTFMFAIGELTIEQYFAQLYAHTDVIADPASAGRLMNGHFGTRFLNEQGEFNDLTDGKHSSSDISPTAAHMPRLLGLAWASKLYRNIKGLQKQKKFSKQGNEVAFGTIGNASTSEGVFLESINAAGVLQVPMLISVWDDDYGISVPKEFHTTKGSISKALSGFQRGKNEPGFEIITAKGWDYEGLISTYHAAAKIAREQHCPVLVHVEEMTQPQGHSTSGSHERYKPRERLQWEAEYDCIQKFREWILNSELAEESELADIETQARSMAKQARTNAWKAFMSEILEIKDQARSLIVQAIQECVQPDEQRDIQSVLDELEGSVNPMKFDVHRAVRRTLRVLRRSEGPARTALNEWIREAEKKVREEYSSHIYSESAASALNQLRIEPIFGDAPQLLDGRQVLQACFDAALDRDPTVIAFGEDVGQIGDVNQAFAGLQAKYGELRVGDTGIREATIIGQAIGAAMRGLKPIAEIQYLDYLLYTLQTLSDDLATLHYRTKGGQKAPVIVRTRGHRLEGVWHSGSPLGMILSSLRGIYVLVPRNMTKAAAFYNTMLASDDTALIIECLNGYRLKEKLPANIGEMAEPLGVPETIRSGTDVTIVTYGSMCRIVMEAANQLDKVGVSTEVIDAQTLLPFDREHRILESVKKTNRLAFADEDVPGGATAYMLQKVIEEQNAYRYLDSKPLTITSKEHRPAYGSDGDYFSKPNVEEVFDKVYNLMSEVDPARYPDIY